jgi:ABC-2 type transport system ATP-binding protein
MPAVVFESVTKSFSRHGARMLLRERIAEWMRPSARTRFEALKNVSFELERGESLGLIGPNGAGKSTLLNLASGLSLPDSGTIQVHGRVAPLLELGAGFHPDLTGAENVRINAALMGLTRRQTRERFEEIIEFSGVRDFIHEPLRTYSNGMMLRLAFAVAVHTDPEILLVDEAIGAGDQAFYTRCLDKIRSFQREGKTIVLASHSIALMTMLCQHALWLDHGRVVRTGPAAAVAAEYQAGRESAANA